MVKISVHSTRADKDEATTGEPEFIETAAIKPEIRAVLVASNREDSLVAIRIDNALHRKIKALADRLVYVLPA